MYVIVRTDGHFVAKSGSLHSYTDKLQHAKQWLIRANAQSELCPGNERVISVEEAINGDRCPDCGGTGQYEDTEIECEACERSR